MVAMNVSLPKQMKSWVEENVQTGSYANSSDYVRDLIRRDQKRAAKIDELQALITEGIESGTSDETIDDIWQRVKKEA